ncbi:MAG: hypothetical protein ACOYMF_16180 [Bacteroidales bacterium]
MQKPFLTQANPDLFTDYTRLSFQLREADSGSLILTSTDGKVIFEKKYTYLLAGYQEININGLNFCPDFISIS